MSPRRIRSVGSSALDHRAAWKLCASRFGSSIGEVMHARSIAGSLAVAALVALSGCTEENGHSPVANGQGKAEAVKVVRIDAGPEAAEKAQEALITAKPGEVVEFGEGTFEFKNQLSLNGIDNVTIRGQGIDKTIL